MKVIVVENESEIAKKTSHMFLEQIRNKSNSVLGFATGSSPLTTYQLLVKDYEFNKTDWSKITTFNLDEYVGLEDNDPQSYAYYMHNNLFKHLNLKKENIHLPCGRGDLTKNSEAYEKLLIDLGPIDLQLLGLGQNGHIGFNEPGSTINTVTRLINLTPNTIHANQRFFIENEKVPTQAISMGIKSILRAKKIILIAFGNEKSEAIKHLVNDKVSADWPCTFLRTHHDVTAIIDKTAAQLLK